MAADERLLEAKANLLKGLGHPKRLKILETLRDGARCVQEIMTELAMEQSSVSQHLAVLRKFALVSARKEGLRVMYQLRFPQVLAILDVADLILFNRARDALSALTAVEIPDNNQHPTDHEENVLPQPAAPQNARPVAAEPGCDPEL